MEVVEDTQWLANIVPVPKKDGKVRMCMDYRDLNKACQKDDFPLPHIDTLIDSAASSAMYFFMDGFSGYNQIMMAVNLKTSFYHGMGDLLLSGDTFWVEECWGHLSEDGYDPTARHDPQRDRSLSRLYDGEIPN